jgi:hypothetical protein
LSTALTFAQGESSGSGLIAGAETTSLRLTASRQLGRSFHVSADGGYLKTSSLQSGAFNSQGLIFGAQANRSLWSHFSAYVSYSAEHQLNQGTSIPSLALNGLIQTLAFGVTYAPEAIHLGH